MRAFLAIDLDDELRAGVAIVQQRLKAAVADTGGRITWVRPAVMHLTVKFLGEFDEASAEPLRAEVSRLVRGQAVTVIPFARIGAFPRAQAPRALWIGPPQAWEEGADARQLSELVRALDDVCVRFGVMKEEKLWRPHLPVGRVRAGERQVGRALTAGALLDEPLSLRPLDIDAISLVKSDLRPDGPVHTKVWTVR